MHAIGDMRIKLEDTQATTLFWHIFSKFAGLASLNDGVSKIHGTYLGFWIRKFMQVQIGNASLHNFKLDGILMNRIYPVAALSYKKFPAKFHSFFFLTIQFLTGLLKGHELSWVSYFSYFCYGSAVSLNCTSDVLVSFGRVQKILLYVFVSTVTGKIIFVRNELR